MESDNLLLAVIVSGIGSIVSATISGWIGLERKREKDRQDKLANTVSNLEKGLHTTSSKLSYLEQQYVDEPRVQKIVDESFEKLKSEFHHQLKPVSDKLDEVLITIAHEQGYRKAIQDYTREKGEGNATLR